MQNQTYGVKHVLGKPCLIKPISIKKAFPKNSGRLCSENATKCASGALNPCVRLWRTYENFLRK